MSKARLVITAVVVEGRSQSEVARAYGVAQSWISRLVTHYRAEGEAAFEPRSRRPKSSPSATALDVVELVLRLRKELTEQGLDAGAHTICWHLHQHHQVKVSPATVWRILSRHGQIIPEPKNRPKSSYLRCEAELPNQMWQTDFTHHRLADGRDVEILNFLDDHSRYLLACLAYPRHRPSGGRGLPRHRRPPRRPGQLSDNAMVFTTRFAGGRAGRNARNGFQTELAHHGFCAGHAALHSPRPTSTMTTAAGLPPRWGRGSE